MPSKAQTSVSPSDLVEIPVFVVLRTIRGLVSWDVGTGLSSRYVGRQWQNDLSDSRPGSKRSMFSTSKLTMEDETLSGL